MVQKKFKKAAPYFFNLVHQVDASENSCEHLEKFRRIFADSLKTEIATLPILNSFVAYYKAI